MDFVSKKSVIFPHTSNEIWTLVQVDIHSYYEKTNQSR